ncbi:nitroreductase [Sphingomonas xanthus]|uniref:Putative NAD(P)H nitroreductase n=2 Tax=Sphingomonas xanthus TaxID=2594473 RepID=A0A516IUW1_9SPHN|nr:nitroreductase [Sphingomonas xanthus]
MTLNDHSSALALLTTRRSGRPREMVAPGPSADELRQILAIAARTPDHGKLAPWRFVIIGNEQRGALADLLSRALDQHDPEAGEAHHLKARDFAHQAPALVILISAPVHNHKIPVWEQQLSCGAAAMNLLHATHALGYVGGWLTGWQACSKLVEAEFCEEGECIAGFLFLGSPGRELEERPRPNLDELVRVWDPPA